MRWLVVLLALVGCGRIWFTPLDGDAGANDDDDGGDAHTACTFESVAIGESFTCVVDNFGGVWCWGNNDNAQVTTPASDAEPGGARIPLPAAAAEVGAGVAFACARLVDGSIWCWGTNGNGELGTGTTTPVTGPIQVSLAGELAVELEVGGRHACARIASDSSIMCWGDNKAFALGTAAPAGQPQAPITIAGTAGTKQFVVGHRHACGIDALDQVFCWGRGVEGQLGSGMVNSATPVHPAGLAPVQSIDATNRVTCVVLVGGGVRCWGARYLGGSSFDQYPASVYVADAVEVATSNYAGCAVHADRTVSCWGYQYSEVGAPIDNNPTPTAGLSNVLSLEGGWYHYCAFTTSGLVCWGDDRQGQLGRGTRDSPPGPAPVTLSCDAMAP